MKRVRLTLMAVLFSLVVLPVGAMESHSSGNQGGCYDSDYSGREEKPVNQEENFIGSYDNVLFAISRKINGFDNDTQGAVDWMVKPLYGNDISLDSEKSLLKSEIIIELLESTRYLKYRRMSVSKSVLSELLSRKLYEDRPERGSRHVDFYNSGKIPEKGIIEENFLNDIILHKKSLTEALRKISLISNGYSKISEETLNLSNYKLFSFPPVLKSVIVQFFKDKAANSLNLSNNRLLVANNLDCFEDTGLKFLDLSYNKLTFLTLASTFDLKGICFIIDLSGNRLGGGIEEGNLTLFESVVKCFFKKLSNRKNRGSIETELILHDCALSSDQIKVVKTVVRGYRNVLKVVFGNSISESFSNMGFADKQNKKKKGGFVKFKQKVAEGGIGHQAENLVVYHGKRIRREKIYKTTVSGNSTAFVGKNVKVNYVGRNENEN